MPRVQVLKNNCTSGEITPKMHRRSDIEQYKNGLATCENAFVSPYGGVQRRNGTKYVSSAKYNDRVCIVRKFIFSDDQAYVLEIGHLYIRFYIDKAQIVQSLTTTSEYAAGTTYSEGDYVQDSSIIYRSNEDGNVGNTPASSPSYWTQTSIVEVTTPFEESMLRSLRFEMSADVLYIFHSSATFKLIRYAHTLWGSETNFFTGGPFLIDNATDVQLDATAITGSAAISVTGYTPSVSNFAPTSNCIDPDGDTNTITGLTAFCDADINYDVQSSTSATGITGYSLECINTKPGHIDDGGTAYNVWGDGTYIYLANETELIAYSFDGTTFTNLDSISGDGYSWDVWGDGTYIYVAGLYTPVSGPATDILAAYTFNGTTFAKVGEINSLSSAYGVWGDGTYIYLANEFDGLRAYTFNGTTFTNVGSIDDGGDARGVWGDGTYIYLANHSDGLRAYTFNGTTFTNVGHIDDGGYAIGVWGDGTYIYLANHSDGLRAYTFNGATFINVGRIDEGDTANGVWADGTYIYLADSNDGLRGYVVDDIIYSNIDSGVSFTVTGLTVGESYKIAGNFKLISYDGDAYWDKKAFIQVDSDRFEYSVTTSWQEKSYAFVSDSTTHDIEIGINVERLSGFSSRPSVKLLWDDVTFENVDGIFYPGHVGSTWKLTEGKKTQSVVGTFTATGQSSNVTTANEAVIVEIDIGSWVATIVIERSFNKGTDWYPYQTIKSGGIFELSDSRDIYYRLNCTAYTSGTVIYKMFALDVDRDGPGTFTITAVDADGLGCTADIVNELSSNDKTRIWAEPEWSDLYGYPLVGKLYEGRLMTAGTTENPTGLWGTSSLDYNDMTEGTNDADAVAFTLNAKGGLNEIKWMVAWDKLMIGTAGGEIRLETEGISPSNPPNKKQDTDYGSSNIQAFLAGRALLFVDKSKRELREYIYDDNSQSFDAGSLSVIGEHILKDAGGAIDGDYQQKHNSIVWLVCEDGTLGCMTYLPLHSVAGWHRHETDGSFESVCTIPGNEGADEVWFSIKRTINGTDVRYIEVLEEETADYNLLYFLDSALEYDSTSTDTISGLDHLEGESVYCLGDGAVMGPYTVDGGSITLETSVSQAVIGLAYTTTVKTLEPDVGAPNGTSYGQYKEVHNAHAHFVETGAGVLIGLDSNSLEECTELTDGQLNTESCELSLDGGDGDGTLIVQMSDPLPMYLAAITYDVDPGDE